MEICSTAIIPNTDAQWLEGANVWAWGSKKETGPPPDTYWSMTKFDVGQDLCNLPGTGTPPSLVHQVYLEAIEDRFNAIVRGHYKGGTADSAYDEFIEAQTNWDGQEYVFASRFGSPDGVVVFRRDTLQVSANMLPNIDDPILKADVLLARVAEIETHPEYHNIPSWSPSQTETLDFLSQVGSKGWTGTWSPKLFEHDEDTWWLAVPCASVSLDPDHSILATHPTWASEQVFQDNFTAAMTRVFDVTDPTTPVPLATLIGPGLATTTSDLEVLKVGTEDYLFAVGYVDGISVWKITDLPGGDPAPVYTSTDPRYFEYWKPPKSVTDLEDGSVFDLVIDKVADDQIWVYASVLRGGVQVLRFDPTKAFGERLDPQGLIQTNARTSGLALRVDGQEKTLIVSDLGAGIRVYGKPE